MANSLASEITEILRAWRAGDEQALDQLTPQIYRELQRAARQRMRNERESHTLQTTALINELYLRLPDLQDIDWQGRAHFFPHLRQANAPHSSLTWRALDGSHKRGSRQLYGFAR